MKKDGFICHLHAGEEEGFTLARAWKQVGGGEKEMLELDIRRALWARTLNSSEQSSNIRCWVSLEARAAKQRTLTLSG